MSILLILPEAENPGGIYERELRAAFPDLEIHAVDHHGKAGPYLRHVEVLMSFSPFMSDQVVRDALRLRWIQVLGSGVDGVINLPALRNDVLVTSGKGVQAEPVSEAALSLMLALGRQMPRMVANQAAHRWERWPSQLLHGRTLGILGVGRIGEALAQRAGAFGMRVIGVTAEARVVAGFEKIYPREALIEAVGEMDYFVVLTPYSPQTHHIVDSRVIQAMKPDAFLINVARGGVVNEAHLAAALRHGQIGGAALDVFSVEPLPEDSDLWSLPNVIISPHLGGLHDAYPKSILPLVRENIALFRAGRLCEMRNIVLEGRRSPGE